MYKKYGIQGCLGQYGVQASSSTPTPPVTYATWNPADKTAGIVLSNGNLTATDTAVGFDAVRSTIGKSTGKWYWEVTVVAPDPGSDSNIGIATSAFVLTDNPTQGIPYVYFGNGTLYHNAVGTAVASYTTGDILSFRLDMDVGTIAFYKNDILQGSYSGLTGTQFALWEAFTPTGIGTANFGATPFAYPVPSGYNEGLYDTVDLTEGLVAHYPLATNSLDISGNGYDGTDTAITYSSGSAVFNGTSSNITIPSNTDFDFGAEYFISTWINMPALPTVGNLFNLFYRFSTALFGAQFELVLFNNGGTQQIFISQATTFNPINYTLPTNQFVNLCVGYTAGVITFYLNSVAIGTVAQAVQCGISTSSMAIGFNNDSLSRYFNGSMKKARIYNRVLNAGEIAALYAEG